MFEMIILSREQIVNTYFEQPAFFHILHKIAPHFLGIKPVHALRRKTQMGRSPFCAYESIPAIDRYIFSS